MTNYNKNFYIEKIDNHNLDLKEKAADIAALAEEIWREHYTPIIGAEQVDYMLEKFQSPGRILDDIKNDGYVYFTASPVNDNGIIGYCACRPDGEYLLLSKLYVRKNQRGRGVARSFLEEAIALCQREYGLDKIRLTVNKYNDNSIAAYRKMGFQTIDSVKTDIGGCFYMDDYIMELDVAPPDSKNGAAILDAPPDNG